MIAERRMLVRGQVRAGVEHGVVAEYNAEDLADDSEDEKRLEKVDQCVERKAMKQKKMCVEPTAIHLGTCILFNPATGSTASSSMQTGYQVPR